MRKERDAAVDSGNRKIKYIREGGKKPQERTDDGSGRCVEGARIWIGGVENRVLVRKAASPRWSGMGSEVKPQCLLSVATQALWFSYSLDVDGVEMIDWRVGMHRMECSG